MKKFFGETLPSVCEKLEAQLKQNGTGWFIGNKARAVQTDICI